MKIAGIDPGIARMGWGIIKERTNTPHALAFGCFETKSTRSISQRLFEIYAFTKELFQTHQPDVLAVEDLFFNTNTSTAFIVGQARGVILLAAEEQHIPLASYTPLQVKVAVTGYGRAEKKQVGEMVRILLKLDTVPKPDDTSDALAIAITHAFTRKNAQ